MPVAYTITSQRQMDFIRLHYGGWIADMHPNMRVGYTVHIGEHTARLLDTYREPLKIERHYEIIPLNLPG